MLVKSVVFLRLKMHHFSGVLPKLVLLPQMEISCHIFKLAIFSKFFGDLMSQIIREYADEEMKSFLYILPVQSQIYFCLFFWYPVFILELAVI